MFAFALGGRRNKSLAQSWRPRAYSQQRMKRERESCNIFWFVVECHSGTLRMRNTNISSLHFQVLDVDSPNYALFVQPNFTISFHIGRNIQMNGKVITTKMNKAFCIHCILLQSCWIQKVTKYVQVINTRQWKNTFLRNFLLSVYRYVSNAEYFGSVGTYSFNFRWQNLDFHFRGYKSLLCTLGVGTWQ